MVWSSPNRICRNASYSIIPFLAKFGPGLINELYEAVRIECPDHQFSIV